MKNIHHVFIKHSNSLDTSITQFYETSLNAKCHLTSKQWQISFQNEKFFNFENYQMLSMWIFVQCKQHQQLHIVQHHMIIICHIRLIKFSIFSHLKTMKLKIPKNPPNHPSPLKINIYIK